MKADGGVCCEYKDIALIEKQIKKIINKINGRKSIFLFRINNTKTNPNHG